MIYRWIENKFENELHEDYFGLQRKMYVHARYPNSDTEINNTRDT